VTKRKIKRAGKMPENVIPADVRQFIFENIDSVVQLEGLLLLRASPGVKQSSNNVAERLYVPEAEVENLLNQLVERNLIQKDGQGFYFYDPATPRAPEIEKFAAIYKQYLLPVTNFIHSKSRSRIQKFADAFRIRKD
jgi:hypothetical protein